MKNTNKTAKFVGKQSGIKSNIKEQILYMNSIVWADIFIWYSI